MEFKNISKFPVKISDNTHVLIIKYNETEIYILTDGGAFGFFYFNVNGCNFIISRKSNLIKFETFSRFIKSVRLNAKQIDNYLELDNDSVECAIYSMLKTENFTVHWIVVPYFFGKNAIKIINEFFFNNNVPITTNQILIPNFVPKIFLKEETFQLNQFLSVKLKQDRTLIYVNNEPFRQCSFLLLNIQADKFNQYDSIESIDEASEVLDSSLENGSNKYQINPKEEFFGHCSNLQAWVENNYDSRLLHKNLAFPLLKELSEVGDKLAMVRFKEEIVERFNSGYLPVMKYLQEEGYLNLLTENEKSYLKTIICIKCGSIESFKEEFNLTDILLNSLWWDEESFFLRKLKLNKKDRDSFFRICRTCFIETFLAYNFKLSSFLDFTYDDFDQKIEKIILSRNTNSFKSFTQYYLGHNIIKHYLYNNSLKPLFDQTLYPHDTLLTLISGILNGDKEVPLIHFRNNLDFEKIDHIFYVSDRVFLNILYLIDLIDICINNDIPNKIVSQLNILRVNLDNIKRRFPSISLLKKIINKTLIKDFEFLFHITLRLDDYLKNNKNHSSITLDNILTGWTNSYKVLEQLCSIIKDLRQFLMYVMQN